METVKSLIEYCRDRKRICPQPQIWLELWEMLPNKNKDQNGDWLPPLPVIADPHVFGCLAHWLVMEQHIEFADKQGLLLEFSQKLHSLKESEWIYFLEDGRTLDPHPDLKYETIRAVLIDPVNKLIKNITWKGGYLIDELEKYLGNEDGIEKKTAIIDNKQVQLIWENGGESLMWSAWKLKGSSDYDINYYSTIVSCVENSSALYSGFYDDNCPLNPIDVAKCIQWVDYNDDLTNIQCYDVSPDEVIP